MQPTPTSPISTSACSSVEVALPLPVSHAWVAYACRAAGAAKPRWNPSARVWTTSATGACGLESISITNGKDPRSVHVKAEWRRAGVAPDEAPTPRRLVTAFLTGMQWAVRRRS